MKRLMIFTSILTLFFSLTAPVGSAFAADNMIANASVETANSTTTPANWTSNKWGTNTTTFEYSNGGHTGSRSLSISMTTRTNGDAKWMHDAVAVQPNTSYTYANFYKSTVATEIDLAYTDTTGAVSYVYGGGAAASASWQASSVKFVTPANVAKVSVLHVIAAKGTLQTDDFNLAPTVVAPPADKDNYILNNSFETADGANPASWYKNNWGTNTAQFSYDTIGRTGTRSAKVTMSAYTNGDAKWYAEPSVVTAGKSYLYRDYYKSTVATRVVVAFIDASGNYTYQEVAGAPVSAAAWSLYNVTFTVPATAVRTTVFHLLDKVGSLSIDDTNLFVALPATTEPVVPNPSFETASGTAPANWQKNNWGSNTAVFKYAITGHTGTKSAKVTVSKYVDGDAKWYFDPIATLKPGSQYRFTAWYKTNVTPHPVAMFTKADGSVAYSAMPVAQPATNASTVWQKYSDTFSVPQDTVSTSVFMYINQNGWLQTDDYSLASYHPDGFSRPLLTMTFDDGHEENATNALPILNQYGLKTTQCFATSFIEGQSQSVINGVLSFKNSGHEICSHTVTHPFLTTSTPTQLTYELQHSQQYLQTLIGKPVTDFATPYGDYNAAVVTQIKKYYRSHRSVDEGFNSKDNFDVYNLRVQNILDTTTAQQVAAWIDEAKTDNMWLILVYHRIANDPGPFDSTISTFTAHVQVIVNSGIVVKTTSDALDEVTTQLK